MYQDFELKNVHVLLLPSIPFMFWNNYEISSILTIYNSQCLISDTSKKMVNVTKGILVECDPAMKQFLLHLDEKFLLGSKFIIQDLDDTHLFISPDVLEMLKSQIDDLMDKISVPIVEGKEALKN